MPQFKIIPSREKTLAGIPDYTVGIEPLGQTVTISYQGTLIAETTEALLVNETKHNEVVYLPRAAMKPEHFTKTEHSTYCPFKGHACYWNLIVSNTTEDNIVWSYESPYDEVSELKDFIAFYPNRTEMKLG